MKNPIDVYRDFELFCDGGYNIQPESSATSNNEVVVAPIKNRMYTVNEIEKLFKQWFNETLK